MRIQARYARWDGVGEPFTLVDTTTPGVPGPGEVLVRVDLATVCGSDLHTVVGRRHSPAPSVLGHEQVGTVIAVGEGGAEPLAPGTRVVWSVTASCGDCARCARGFTQKCLRLRKYGHEPLSEPAPLTGGFATHCVLLPGTAIAVVPDTVPDAVAAPASCATATVAAALAAAGPVTGRRVLVTGAGMLGITAVAMAARAGAHVLAVDPDPDRRALALRFGAAEASDTAPDAADGAVGVAVELSGKPGAVDACLRALDIGGVAVLAGSVAPADPVLLDPERLVRGLHRVVGVHNYQRADLLAAVDFLAANGDLPFADLVAAPIPLSDLASAFGTPNPAGVLRRAVAP